MISIIQHRQPLEHDYKGLSTDTKPTDCAINSTFLELDTARLFYFTGEEWKEVGGDE